MTSDYTKIFSGNAIFVNRLKSLLEQEKIPSLIKDSVNSAHLAGFAVPIDSIELFVLNNYLENALPIIETFKSEIKS